MILKNKYQPIKELQNEAIKRHGKLKSGWNVIEAIRSKKFSEDDVRKRIFNLIVANYDLFSGLVFTRIVYFQKRHFENANFLWEMTFVKPSEQAFLNGEAKYIMDSNFDKVAINYNKENSVLIVLQAHTHIIFFNEKYEDIPKLINKLPIIKRQTYMKEGTKNIIAALIIGISIIVSAVIYAYSTRWEINNNGSARIDKWTGKIERVHQ